MRSVVQTLQQYTAASGSELNPGVVKSSWTNGTAAALGQGCHKCSRLGERIGFFFVFAYSKIVLPHLKVSSHKTFIFSNRIPKLQVGSDSSSLPTLSLAKPILEQNRSIKSLFESAFGKRSCMRILRPRNVVTVTNGRQMRCFSWRAFDCFQTVSLCK